MPKAQRRAEKLAAQDAYNRTPEGQAELARKQQEKKLRKLNKYDKNNAKNAAKKAAILESGGHTTATAALPKPPNTKKELKRQKAAKKQAQKQELIASLTRPGMTKYQIRKALQEHKCRLKEEYVRRRAEVKAEREALALKASHVGGGEISATDDTKAVEESVVEKAAETSQVPVSESTSSVAPVEDDGFISFTVDTTGTLAPITAPVSTPKVKSKKKRSAPVDDIATETVEPNEPVKLAESLTEAPVTDELLKKQKGKRNPKSIPR
jgi:hypothetical protein